MVLPSAHNRTRAWSASSELPCEAYGEISDPINWLISQYQKTEWHPPRRGPVFAFDHLSV
jgi:hypothetical protein